MTTDTGTTGTGTMTSIYRSTTQALTEPMQRFLDRQHFGTLGTLEADDTIHLVPTWYLFEDGRLYVATWSGSRKARNAAARPRVTYTVDDRESASWVSARGTAELVTGAPSAALNDRLRRRYMTERGLEVVGPLLERTEDATIAITVHRWTAWDYESTMLAALQDAGVPLDDADGWYLP